LAEDVGVESSATTGANKQTSEDDTKIPYSVYQAFALFERKKSFCTCPQTFICTHLLMKRFWLCAQFVSSNRVRRLSLAN
jgi:hypothetical protein